MTWKMTESRDMNDRFRSLYGVPAASDLRCVSYTASFGGGTQNWEHHEIDGNGRLIATYLSYYAESSSEVMSRYRKYDSSGSLVEDKWLPTVIP